MIDKTSPLLKRILRHELITGSFWLFMGGFIASVFSFLANLFFARNLSTIDYGIYTSLLSIVYLSVIPAQSINTIIVKFAGGFFARDEISKASYFYKKSLLIIVSMSILIMFLFLLLGNFINNFLHVGNFSYVLLTGVVVAVSYLAIVNNAFIQSLLKFKFLSFLNITSSIFRLGFSIFLVFMGFKVFGALVALVISSLIPFLLGFLSLRFLVSGKNENIHSGLSKLRSMLSYAIPSSLSVLFLSSFISSDVLLVKHFLSAHEAGLYGGLSLVGKVIFYLPGPIASAMFPLLVRRHTKGEAFSRLFYLALFLVVVPSFLLTAFYFIFPEFVINFFLGREDYLEIAKYLGWFGVYISIFSILNIFVNFFLSTHEVRIFVPIALFNILQIFLISIFHNNIYQVLISSLTSSGLLLLTLLLYYMKIYGAYNFRK